eukprot:6998617-Prymnesium_polylepis.1
MWVRHSPATRTAFLPRRRLVARTAMARMGRGSELHVVGTVSVSARSAPASWRAPACAGKKNVG